MERSVDGTPIDDNDSRYFKSKDTSLAERFLQHHSTVKIVVIVDTHCVENGYFAWNKNGGGDYESCSLFEVSSSTLSFSPFRTLMTSIDPPRLYSPWRLQISIGCKRYTNPQPQNPDCEPCMWRLHLSGCCTKRVA